MKASLVGIEPTLRGLEARVLSHYTTGIFTTGALPLSYTPALAEVEGFEPTTSGLVHVIGLEPTTFSF
jgi:hypothetical protein